MTLQLSFISRHLFITIAIIYFPIYLVSQNSVNFENLCVVTTENNTKAKGINLKLYFPCNWLEFDGERPSVVNKYGYQIDNEFNTQMICVIVIDKVKGIPDNTNPPSDIFSESQLKKNIPPGSTYIGSRAIKVDGLNCGETIFKLDYPSANGVLFAKSISYALFYKDKVINISYGINSNNNSICNNSFTKYLPLFKKLISKTVILNQW